MRSSTQSAYDDSCNRLNRRIAVCGPACTVVWEGESREVPPYPDRRDASAPFAHAFHLIVQPKDLMV